MNKQLLTLGLAIGALSLPQEGFAWGSANDTAKKTTDTYGAFSADLYPQMQARFGTFSLGFGESGFDYAAFGLGLQPEFTWKNIARIRGRTVGSFGRAQLSGRVTTAAFDSDLSVTAFAPIFERLQMGFSAGWEYKYWHTSAKILDQNTYQTGFISYMNGAFFGLSFEGTPTQEWEIEAAMFYHLPSARLKAVIDEDISSSLFRMTGARYGWTGFFGSTWKFSEQWSFRSSLEYTHLGASGSPLAEEDEGSIELEYLGFNYSYLQFTTGLNYTF